MDAATRVGRGWHLLTQVERLRLLGLLDSRAVQVFGGLAVHGGLRCNLEQGRSRRREETSRGRECGGGERAPHLSTVQRKTAKQIMRKLVQVYCHVYRWASHCMDLISELLCEHSCTLTYSHLGRLPKKPSEIAVEQLTFFLN